LQIDLARVEYWQGQGAQLSARVSALLDDYRAAQQPATGAAAA
jgi:ribosomal protein S16